MHSDVTIGVKVEGEEEAISALRRIHRFARGPIDFGYIGLLIVIVFFASFLGARTARAQDSRGIEGVRHGCVDFSVTSAGTTYTSSSLENMAGSTALPSGLYWSVITIKGTSGTVYLCEAAAASCGADTTNKMSIASGASLTEIVYGLGLQSIALFGVGIVATTGQLCGKFWVSP